MSWKSSRCTRRIVLWQCGQGRVVVGGVTSKCSRGAVNRALLVNLLRPTRVQRSRPYLQTRIRRLHTTIRFGCGRRENAQTIPARLDSRHTAHTGSLILFSQTFPPLCCRVRRKLKHKNDGDIKTSAASALRLIDSWINRRSRVCNRTEKTLR